MKAILINQFGKKECLKYVENLEKPVPRKSELLVRVMAASVNPVDCKIRSGEYAHITGKRFPKIIGADFSGWIEAIGPEVKRFQKRERIFGTLVNFEGNTGSYADYLVIDEKSVASKPDALSYSEAACLPIAALTALQGLIKSCSLQAGQSVLINGASGGVGTFAVQLAHLFGAEITAVCSAKNADLVCSLGAGKLIDYHKTDFTQQKVKYDLIFDAIGNKNFDACKPLLNKKGIYFTTSQHPLNQRNALLTSLRDKKVKIGSVRPNHVDLSYLAGLVAEKKLKVIIDERFELTDAAAAHGYSESGHVTGKLVLNVK
jgi:NADPH:quinone reductase-like Zn-dependent oxidoreductase